MTVFKMSVKVHKGSMPDPVITKTPNDRSYQPDKVTRGSDINVDHITGEVFSFTVVADSIGDLTAKAHAMLDANKEYEK